MATRDTTCAREDAFLARTRKTREKDAVTGDIGIIKSFLDKIKSKSVKATLESIVGDPAGKKRKRDGERIGELEFSLKKTRNACDACRCGRASYY